MRWRTDRMAVAAAGICLFFAEGRASTPQIAGRWDAMVVVNTVEVPFRFEIAQNDVYSNAGYGIQLYEGAGTVFSRVSLHDNRWHSNGNAGILVSRGADQVTIARDITYANAQAGVQTNYTPVTFGAIGAGATAGRSTPCRRPSRKRAVTIPAPVLPAVTKPAPGSARVRRGKTQRAFPPRNPPLRGR